MSDSALGRWFPRKTVAVAVLSMCRWVPAKCVEPEAVLQSIIHCLEAMTMGIF